MAVQDLLEPPEYIVVEVAFKLGNEKLTAELPSDRGSGARPSEVVEYQVAFFCRQFNYPFHKLFRLLRKERSVRRVLSSISLDLVRIQLLVLAAIPRVLDVVAGFLFGESELEHASIWVLDR